MVSEELGRELHDRATRGEALSAAEQAQLQSWYESQDQAEAGLLGHSANPQPSTNLQSEVNAALARLAAVTKHLQEVAAENDVLRREIAALRQQLQARTSFLQPA